MVGAVLGALFLLLPFNCLVSAVPAPPLFGLHGTNKRSFTGSDTCSLDPGVPVPGYPGYPGVPRYPGYPGKRPERHLAMNSNLCVGT
eukprot:3933764-Rhodomonas_salina.2